MNKKKVLFLSAANSIHTIRWVNALSKKFEVHLVYCKNHKPNLDVVNSKVIMHELSVPAPLGYYLNAFQLRKLFHIIKPNIVNAHYASGYGTLARIAKIKPLLLSIWGSDVYDFPNESTLKKKILEKNIFYADEIASTSIAMAKELKRQFPNLKKEIFITPFGVDTNKFKNMHIEREDEDFNIGNIKALEEKYGIEYLILGVEELLNNLKNKDSSLASKIKLYIYGDGSQREYLENLITSHNLNNNVFLMGKIPNNEVPNKLNEFDVFCASSVLNSESFGVAVVEAMACEVPVIATDTDGFCEVIENGKTGILIQKKNSAEICNALFEILNNKKKALEYGKDGRKRVIQKYDWNKNVTYMVHVYNQIMENN